jgi:O-antigen/teichoic acid export membrane protein
MAFRVASRVAGLGALTAAGQLLIIGSLPAYSKIFDPSTYGEYVIFVGAFTVISVLAGVRYDSAIVLPRNDRVAATLSVLVMLIAVSVSAAIAAVSLAASTFRWTPDRWVPIASHLGYGLAVATTLGALQRCLTSWCVRGGRFLLIGWGQFAFCLLSVIAQLSLARVMQQLPALIWGYVCALGFQTGCLATLTMSLKRDAWKIENTLRGLKFVARKYRRFPAYMVGYALASSLRDRLIQVVLGIGAGAAVVGRFGLAYRVVFAPNSLVYSAVSPVFFSIASRGNRVSVGRFAASLVEATFVVLVVPYVGFAIEAPALTDAVLSEKWRGTGPYLQALAAPALMLVATCWLDRAFDSFRRQSVAFSLEASFTFTAVILVGVLSKFIQPISVVWAFAMLASVYYWTYFLLTFIACGFPMADFRRASRNGLIAIVMGSLGAFLAQLSARLEVRAALYALVMASVIGVWLRSLGGAATMRALMQSRIGSE